MILQPTGIIDFTDTKTMLYAPNACLLLFYLLIGKNQERYLLQFKKICLLSIMSIFIAMILCYRGVITNAFGLILAFCGLVFATSVMVLISGIRHGIFND